MVATVPPADQLSAPPPAALRLVPGLERGQEPVRCQRLSGGTVNHVWRVASSQGEFALRVDGPASQRPGVDRQRELPLHRAAAAAGLAPAIAAAAADGSVLVTRFVAGEVWSPGHFTDRRRLRQLGNRLAQLHALPVPTLAVTAFDPAGVGGRYLAMQKDAAPLLRNEAQVQLQQVAAAAQRVAAGSAGLTIVHGDPTHANLIDDGVLWLIDWEYAQLADPIYDVAAVLAYYPASLPQRDELLAAAQTTTAQARRLAAAIRVHQGLGWLWHYARGSRPPRATGAAPRLPAN